MNNTEVMQKIEKIIFDNDMEAFKKTIDALENVDIQDKYGWTPLHLAIRRGREEMVRYLVEEKNADIDIQDASGWTPLMEAIMDDFPQIVKYLVEKGADLSIANNRGATAPMLAQKFQRVSMFEYLS